MLKNSAWALSSNIIQNLCLSAFFIILARHYSTSEFAHFLIANTLYQFIASVSTMGLGQWFIREIVNSTDKNELTSRFLKIQLYFGICFFLFNIGLSFVLYDDFNINVLSIILGINILFDNLIYSIKYINIAEFEQKKTFKILAIEAILRLLISIAVFIYPLSIVSLSVLLIIIRFATLRLFLKMGGSSSINNLTSFSSAKVSFSQVKQLVYANWPFVIVGAVSVTYWRIANIIVAKSLTLMDVVSYEISYKAFTIVQILPIVVITSVFPAFVKMHKEGNLVDEKGLYKKMFRFYSLYGIFSYTFVYTFADLLLPLVFGSTYESTSQYTKQMFLTMLIYPTAYLQANILIAIKLEKYDMWYNVISLVLYIAGCLVGLQYIKSLSIINISLFVSFAIFHILQDIALIKRGISSLGETILFYLGIAASILIFTRLYDSTQSYWVPAITWILLFLFFLPVIINKQRLKPKPGA